ncbi:uncharacterized protein LOC131937423 [Physella acuta]|uniref:uncharacterized protein LOC131937423 n=1 Tax=Physella acuta TaxID=109671 RepID=UPI0027DC5AC9|nr:uncharacterized protein LOC131937423 [Physella acuta]
MDLNTYILQMCKAHILNCDDSYLDKRSQQTQIKTQLSPRFFGLTAEELIGADIAASQDTSNSQVQPFVNSQVQPFVNSQVQPFVNSQVQPFVNTADSSEMVDGW